MSPLAPHADPREQLRLAAALGLKALRLRDRPLPAAPARLRIAVAEPLDTLLQDHLLQALLRSLALSADDVGPRTAGDGPLLTIDQPDAEADATLPALANLRGNAGAKRALWPALRRLRRRLLHT